MGRDMNHYHPVFLDRELFLHNGSTLGGVHRQQNWKKNAVKKLTGGSENGKNLDENERTVEICDGGILRTADYQTVGY
jgi:hypothetical protein